MELTLHQAADSLGVHYMTVYRYVRLGLLAADKVGGTWRVLQADVDSFGAEADSSFETDSSSESGALSVAGMRPRLRAVPTGRRRAPWAGRVETRLIAGDLRGSWGVIEAALSAGAGLDEVYLDVLAPALHSIGERWAAGELDISVEHRATAIAMRMIGRLGPRFARRGRTRGVVIVGTGAGERHVVSTAMLADLLRRSGWEVSDLGADNPTESIIHAVHAEPEATMIALAATTDVSLESLAEVCAGIRAESPHMQIVVGGRAIRGRDHAVALGAHHFAASLDEVVRLTDSLDRSNTRSLS